MARLKLEEAIFMFIITDSLTTSTTTFSMIANDMPPIPGFIFINIRKEATFGSTYIEFYVFLLFTCGGSSGGK